ncbi:MAG: thiamine-phosphate kinase [Rhodospirillales bacterium]
MGKPKKPDEFELISRYFAPLAAGEPGAMGLTDDAAVLTPEPGPGLVVTTDTLVEGVHFPAGEDPGSVAARILGVNLSDLAAMAAEPWAYTLSVALPANWDEPWVKDFADGLGAQQAEYGIVLVGGDTVATPGPLSLTLTALGRIADGGPLTRSGAEPGDDIYVSGTVGDAALGLKELNDGIAGLEPAHAEHLVDRYRRPRPRVRLGRRLAGLARAAIDVSDGLVADLGHVAEASGCAATVEASKVPLSEAAAAAIILDPALRDLALTGGDDYELLFAAPSSAAAAVRDLAATHDVPLTAIGRIGLGDGDGARVRVVDADGLEVSLAGGGYRHF